MHRFLDILYAILTTLIALAGPLYRKLIGKWDGDWQGHTGRTNIPATSKKRVLIHAVSVGEINAAKQLVAQINQQWPQQVEAVVCPSTTTGLKQAQDNFAESNPIARFPFDHPLFVRTFLNRTRPDAIVMIESDIWPGFMRACYKRNIPVLVLNGRMSDRSHRKWKRMPSPVTDWLFSNITGVAVQDETYRQHFTSVGVPPDRVTVAGNMKWDTALISNPPGEADKLAKQLGINRDKPLIVVGSSGPGEEALITQQLDKVSFNDQPIQFLFVPRKPERFDEAAAAIANFSKQTVVRWSHCVQNQTQTPADQRYFLLDTIGRLTLAYELADMVIIGRTFNHQRGSNMLEPLAFAKPTIIGPNTQDFVDITQTLLNHDAIIQLDSPDQLAPTVESLFSDTGRQLGKRGLETIRSQQGATSRNLRVLAEAMNLPISPSE